MTDDELDRVVVIPRLKAIGVGGAVGFAAYLSMEFVSKPETWPVFLEFLKNYPHPGVVKWATTVATTGAREELIEHANNLRDACDLLAQTVL